MSAVKELVAKIEEKQASCAELIKCFHFGERTYMRLRQEIEFCLNYDGRGKTSHWYGIPIYVHPAPSDPDRMDIEMEPPFDNAALGIQVFKMMARESRK